MEINCEKLFRLIAWHLDGRNGSSNCPMCKRGKVHSHGMCDWCAFQLSHIERSNEHRCETCKHFLIYNMFVAQGFGAQYSLVCINEKCDWSLQSGNSFVEVRQEIELAVAQNQPETMKRAFSLLRLFGYLCLLVLLAIFAIAFTTGF